MILIIAGHSRSGTSILNRLCNSHPQIAVTKELGSFAYLGSTFPQYSKLIIKRWRFIRNFWPVDAKTNRRRLQDYFKNTIFFTRFLIGIGLQREERVTHKTVESSLRKIYPKTFIVGDKWPYYTFKLPELKGLDGVKCLVIYRDCRDVTSSFLQKTRTNWQGQDWIANLQTTDQIAERWVKMITIMESCADEIYTIRYEDLAFDPQKTMASIGEWLQIDPQLFSTGIMKPSSIGKFKNGLSQSELESVLRVAGPTMERLGYL